jgi:glycosyltransferase involved in cell wall biosynthesis
MSESAGGRLALLIPSLRGGGAEISNVRLANCLAGRGLSVDLVVLQASGPWLEKIDSAVRLVDLRAPRARRGLFALTRYLRRTKPAALVAGPVIVGVLAIIARTLSRAATPVVVVEHNDWRGRRARTGLRGERMARWAMRATYRFADRRLAVSSGVADSLAIAAGLKRTSVGVLYNGIDVGEIERLMREPVEHPWLANRETPVLLAAGRLVEQKGYGDLLRAVSVLVRSRPVRLLILGEGPLRERLEGDVRELGLESAVMFLGFQPNPYPWMAQASAFVQASLFEGLPTAILEALACGAPVVATDCPSGPSEILQGGEFGVLTPPGDPEALAEAIERLLDDESLRRTLLNRGPKRARAFSIDRSADALLEVLSGLGVSVGRETFATRGVRRA